MGVQERKIREKEVLRRKILDAARDLFVEKGYEHFTMRELGDRIEYTPTTIYLYFKDKDELIGEVCEETFRGLLKKLEKVRGKFDDPVETIRAGCRAYVDFGLTHPSYYRVSFMSSPMRDFTAEELRHLNEKYPAGLGAYNFLREAVETCIRGGKFRLLDADAAAQTLWAAIHGVTSLLIVKLNNMKDVELAPFKHVPQDRLIDLVIDTVIQGMRK